MSKDLLVGADNTEPSEAAAGGFSADLHLVTLFIPTALAHEPGQLLTLKLQARGGLELRALARVLRWHEGGSDQVSGIDVQLLDVRALEQPLEIVLASLRPPSLQPSAETLRVLLVDDDATLRTRTAELLRADGYEVLEARNGAEALSIAINERVAAIVSDVRMPLVDGWQLLRLVRARPDLSDVPMLFHTSLTSDAERFRGYALGLDDYVDKPAHAQDLIERVERALARRRQRVEGGHALPLLRGDLAHVSLGTLLSLLEVEQRTGLLILRHAGMRAQVELADGTVVAVRVEPSIPEATDLARMCWLLDWSDGEFELVRGRVDAAGRQGLRSSHILLEHARTRDENAR